VPRALHGARGRAAPARGATTPTAAKQSQSKNAGGKPGFKYDGAMQRWVRDDRLRMDYDDEEFDPTVQPKSGGSYTLWPVVHSELTDYGLKSITPDEVIALQKKGAILIDVREEPQYNNIHAAGALSFPLFIPVQGNSVFDNTKRLAMALFAMEATERNPDFKQMLQEELPKKKKVIVMCATGGTLKTVINRTSGAAGSAANPSGKGRVKVKNYNDPERAFGRESRSLKACYEVLQAGFKDIVHVEGGLNGWRNEGYPTEEVE